MEQGRNDFTQENEKAIHVTIVTQTIDDADFTWPSSFVILPKKAIEVIKLEKDKMKIETMEPKTRITEANPSKIVSREQWVVARKDLLTREKELTKLRDEVSRHRRELPWVKIDKEYAFDGPDGRETLADLFAGRSQLIIYHFMFHPDWKEGCPSCSFVSDHLDGACRTSRHAT